MRKRIKEKYVEDKLSCVRTVMEQIDQNSCNETVLLSSPKQPEDAKRNGTHAVGCPKVYISLYW